jgi:hypothetical protein
MKFKCILAIQLALAAVVLSHPTRSFAQDEEDRVTHWFSSCTQAQCGDRHLAGPFPNEHECEHYIDGMRAQGFPFEPCRSVTLMKPMRTGYVTILGAGIGAIAGYAFAGGTAQTTPAAVGEGAVAGAAIGFGLATLYNHSIKNSFAGHRVSPFNEPTVVEAQKRDLPTIRILFANPYSYRVADSFARRNNSFLHDSPIIGAQRLQFSGFVVSVPFQPGMALIHKLHRRQQEPVNPAPGADPPREDIESR